MYSGLYFPSLPLSASVSPQYLFDTVLPLIHLNPFFWIPSFSLSNIPVLLYAPRPLLCVGIRLQQWTLRAMVMECIWGANSFLSPTSMQNRPNGESLAPVYNTERGTSTMVTPLLSLKPLADRSAQSPPVKTFYCWIKKKAEEEKKKKLAESMLAHIQSQWKSVF